MQAQRFPDQQCLRFRKICGAKLLKLDIGDNRQRGSRCGVGHDDGTFGCALQSVTRVIMFVAKAD